ncbi:uncharacterized protein LOC114520403 isoform X2 [Dendronephthya gigantea]|uniref:uncharacterized protein LOC114520403 isoform X2 n=1 Tax=Dendronephthya gigantea TaxID=151771 RepID=UPI00106D568C|nr:uncharacterized protein LOC114520403 isoform X2 [Dendronephthya gigantea]
MMKQDEFVGREWLFDDIDSWITRDLEANESRAFVIWGAAGTGKTSFAREFVRRHKERKLVAYHFFEKDNPLTYHVQTIVLDLQKVLKKNLPGYAASFIPGDKLRTQPEKLFSTLITEPLQKLPENDKMFLLVDALDESDSTASSCFIKLSTNLPQWLRILFTSRHDVTELSNHFQDSCFASLDDFKSSPQTLLSLTEDIREFVATKYTKLQGEYPNTIPPFFANNDQAAKEKVVEASHNCFLYAKLVMEHIFAGHGDIGLPRSLFDLYDLDFERRFADVKFFQKKIAPVIEMKNAL